MTTPSADSKDKLNDETAGVVAWPPGIAICTTIFGALLHGTFPIAVLPPLPARLTGGALCLAGAILATWAKNTMKAIGTNVHPNEPTLAIVSTGPYRFTRNPMYVSLLLLHLGVALLINGLLPVLMVIPLFAILWFGVVAREERYLARRFGETYLNYKKTTRRWI